jgi:demethylmenaquinone methyltransferase/2-methoxy-6-polyprenyl-1,4-benzoquinol methylase
VVLLVNDTRGLTREIWHEVITAIEESIPSYDQVNDMISFGKAQLARKYAIHHLKLRDGVAILDAGIGPGTTSKLLLSTSKPRILVGLDASVKQLKAAKANLADLDSGTVDVVRASFEYLPFKNFVFDGIITCYALRDSLDILKSVTEYSRVVTPVGSFADVDIGKPDNSFKRWGSHLYIKHVMPLLAKMAIRNKMRTNPWKMIGPTYDSLPRNSTISVMIRKQFPVAELKEFLMGGIIVIIGRKC